MYSLIAICNYVYNKMKLALLTDNYYNFFWTSKGKNSGVLSLQQVFKSLLQVLELPSLFASIYMFEFSFVVVLLIIILTNS